MHPNLAKQRLKEGRLALGLGLRQARTVDIASAAATCGFDWLFIDMEHNAMSVDTAAQIAAAAPGMGVTPIVRVPGHEHYHATRLLNEQILVVVMLESPRAIENAEEIAAVPGVDVLLIGTSDLCAEIGILGQVGDARVEAAYRRVIDACRRHGKHPGMGGVYDPPHMEKYVRMGMRFVLCGSDLSLLMAAAKERAGFLRKAAGEA